MKYADQLSILSESSQEDKIAYSQINKVLRILSQLSNTNIIRKGLKTEFPERIGEVETKYLKILIEAGRKESSGSWRKTYHLINKK